ncbi:MAG: hypothetical protein EAZ50_09375 [Runella slithyformis]|nr:MAG: hypothetical protein EAY79_05200 [Runella slithyformis]TAF80212.1 MAG: hypothetical protein EAZ50_09375 [Runella slithyformis]
MKETPVLYLSYTDLSPSIENIYIDETHQKIIAVLRRQFLDWSQFFDKYGSEFSLGFFVSTKKGTEQLTIFGPSVSRKMKVVDFSIFLPDEIKDLNHYLDLVFEGIGVVLARFKVDENEILKMKNECKKELNLI